MVMSVVKMSTSHSLEFLVSLGQLAFLFPVTICGSKNSHFFVKFSWLSLKTITAIVFIGFSLFKAVLFFMYVLNQNSKFPLLAGLAFYCTVLVYKILFICMARKWSNLMRKWDEVDFFMRNYVGFENYRPKMKFVMWTFFVLALAEHIFYMFSLGIVVQDNLGKNLDKYLSIQFKFVFMVFPYNRYLALFIEVLNWLWTFIWNYADIFLILLCIPLSFRFAQIERKVITMVKYKLKDTTDWKNIREDFVGLIELCCKVEDCVSPLIVASYANKLYVVMNQLVEFMICSKESGKATSLNQRLYFAFSFVCILLRLAAVTIYASEIDDKSKDIVSPLFSVSSDAYNIEVERFITCLQVSQPVITGGRIFQLRKSLLLKIASSIIVYELVLMKFQDF